MKSSDKEKIKSVFEKVYAANVKSEDLCGYGEMYTEDALWMAPNVADRVGINDIVEGFSEQIASNKIDPIFTAEEIEVIGDFGYVLGISFATIYPKDGSPSKLVKFRALWLMKKQDNNWKISRQIWNNKPL
ncbi:YybH family protein [uncultured Nostoc sp.]|uniref:YybH family protein n=1 Tax=uncultured Nostoc sp. TaxID=340711 RepID=UPI0035CC81E3